ncbi:alpha amylase, catalytic domain-containing protein [Ditylenchus destructor]|nr:alpha amylase, catalytic domain-containing protein [Ditylenchus destructor]
MRLNELYPRILDIYLIFIFITVLFAVSEYDYDNPHTLARHFAMVHLFEWKWDDIANECENYLANAGYGAVQVSPPTEHLIKVVDIDGKGRKDVPWYVRYQPTGYKLISRSGNESQFRQMVKRCNDVGVRIVVDMVLNHMAGAGQSSDQPGIRSSGGSAFNSTPHFESFPGANYTADHFNDFRCDGDIQGSDYTSNAERVRNCRLVGLVDLNHGHPHVQDTIVQLLNRLIRIGVAGFRFDAAKHMWPADMGSIIEKLDPLNEKIFSKNQKPFIFHEVIDKGGEATKVAEYVQIGRYTNFNFGIALANAVQNFNGENYASLADLHEGHNYGNMADHEVVNFVDNHDNQRYEKDFILTHKKEDLYKMAVSFMLAWTYGYPRVMSSYYFNITDQGPPSSGSADYEIRSPTFNSDGTCKSDSGWVCEHRWPEIRRMLKFRSDTAESAVSVIHKETHILAFARSGKGFFAANNDDAERKLVNLDTTLPAGNYCNIYANDECSSSSFITVDSDGKTTFSVPRRSIVAFTIKSLVSDSMPAPISDSRSSWNRTIVFLYKETALGEYIHIRGGNANMTECDIEPSTKNKCSIPIVHETKLDVESDELPSMVYSAYQEWKQSDNYLDFYGAEARQGTHDGVEAGGTPLIWTTNASSDPAFNSLNAEYNLGGNYWMVDLLMDCNKANNSFFEFKGWFNGDWENAIAASENTCMIGQPKSMHNNHVARCGAVNIFKWGVSDCRIIPDDDYYYTYD